MTNKRRKFTSIFKPKVALRLFKNQLYFLAVSMMVKLNTIQIHHNLDIYLR